MLISTKRHKLILPLLIIASIVFIINDQTQFQSKKKKDPLSPKEIDGNLTHSHGNANIDHANPETQKRMGIYHYNEGNKFLKINNLEKATNEYKMALHHFKNFDEVYINLSTAYMYGKQFKAALKTLNDLQKINPEHPLLYYNLACYYALTGETTLAIQSLQQAISKGFNNITRLNTDRDLQTLRSKPQFKNLQKSILAKKNSHS